jgi:hypothetical protein
MYTYQYLEPNMEKIRDAAFVVSVHDDVLNRTVRINLRWKGNRDISDFALDVLGEIVRCEAETENTGWVIVRSSHLWHELSFPPVSQFGHAILRSSNLVDSGDEIPLKPKFINYHC